MECDICAATRESRCRVARSADDKRFHDKRFTDAVAIVANNDVKYDTNKKRALKYAQTVGEGVTWSVAQDTPTTAALRENPSIVTKKKDWLKRHDRESGDLYGMLPLVHGMPVALTDHLDRSPDKALLRGSIGKIHSWTVPRDEPSKMEQGERVLSKQPVVFVKFEGATWKLDGMSEAGLYPVRPIKKSWFLDPNRPHPQLRIKRQQLPLAPAFAITTHAAQGQTLDAAIVDLNFGRESNPRTGYVAITRVRSREDILIFRPFPRELFTRGAPEGPTLLLQKLRGERIDWEDVVARLLRKPGQAGKRVRCNGCSLLVEPNQLATGQPGMGKFCEACASTRVTCALCAEEKTRADFPREVGGPDGQATCWDCRTEEGSACQNMLQRREYSPEELAKPRTTRRCRTCAAQEKQNGKKIRCNGCKQLLDPTQLVSEQQCQGQGQSKYCRE